MPGNKLKLYIEQSSDTQTLNDLYDVFRDFLRSIRVHYCTITSVSVFQKKIYMSALYEQLPNYTFKIEDEYKNLVNTALGQRSLNASKAFFWDDSNSEGLQNSDQRMKSYISDEGLAAGFCVPVFHSLSTKSSAMFLFRRMEKAQEQAFALQTSVFYLLNDVMRISSGPVDPETYNDTPRKPPLSTREAQIITWIAMGKSSWETATILGISEHTVNGHVENAVRKLDAKNRTEAVAIALLTHQLDFGIRAGH